LPAHENNGLVDVQVHPPTKEFLIDAGGIHAVAAARKFGHEIKLSTFEEMLEEYSSCGVKKLVLFAWDAETTSHRPRVSNEFVSKIVDRYPDRIVGFASVDPHKELAVKDLEYAIRQLRLSGLKLHPQVQAFEPNDPNITQYTPSVWNSISQSHFILGQLIGVLAWREAGA
jgi:hypothetical protein